MSTTVGRYHLFQRKDDQRGLYYYWFLENDKRLQRSCGRQIETKRQAVEFLENLCRQELEAEKQKSKKKTELQKTTLESFSRGMFDEGSKHIIRWEAKGKTLKRNTLAQYRQHLEHYLLPKFGKLALNEIKPVMVEDHLLAQPLSNSCRNTITYTLKTILREARREDIIDTVPEFEPFKRNGRRQDVLSSEELQALFPENPDDLIRVWRRPDNMKKEPDEIALMFGTMFCLTVSAGLRSGEIRAIHSDQISIPHSGLVIDRAIDEMGKIGALKKATADDPRSRAVVVPAITMNMLKHWLPIAPECENYPNLLFSYRNKPIANYYILDRFRFGLDRLGIDHESRRLTVHCLRYTYNTRMRTLLSEQVLRDFVGHRSMAMTDYYDRPILLERLEAYQSVRPAVEHFWG
jgi:integrase